MSQREQTARYEIGKVKAMLLDRIINCTTAILMYVEIKLAAGWSRKVSAAEIYQELGISKPSFYRAISKLQTTGWVNWTAPETTEFELSRGPKSTANYSCLTSEPESQDRDSESQDRDDQSHNRDSESQIRDSESQERDKRPLEDSQGKGSSDPSTLSHLSSNLLITLDQQTSDLSLDPNEQPTANAQQPDSELSDQEPTGSEETKPISPSRTFNVAELLEMTKQKLKEQSWLQADQRNQKRGITREHGLTSDSPVGTQGSSLTRAF